jgi:hypothetical protein
VGFLFREKIKIIFYSVKAYGNFQLAVSSWQNTRKQNAESRKRGTDKNIPPLRR